MNQIGTAQEPVLGEVLSNPKGSKQVLRASPTLGQVTGISQSAPSTTFLRLSVGTVYFFFGFVKFFPDLSPAEVIASQTVMRLSFGIFDAQMALFLLAIMECTIGICFLFNLFPKWLFLVFMFHQISTFTPLFLYPELCFKFAPFAPTMEGQYILKNLVFVAAGWTILLPSMKASWAKWHQDRQLRRSSRGLRVDPLALEG